jgi:hypothetical protein
MGAHAKVIMYKKGLFWYFNVETYGKFRRKSKRFLRRKDAEYSGRLTAKLLKARFILYEAK